MNSKFSQKQIDHGLFDLASSMESLYQTMDYCISIPPRTVQSPDTYWDHSIDPDGRHRNRLTERESYLDNIEEELGFIKGLKPGKILDVGCGPGWLLSAIDPGWDRYGIEPSPAAASIAAKYATVDAGYFEEDNFKNKNFEHFATLSLSPRSCKDYLVSSKESCLNVLKPLNFFLLSLQRTIPRAFSNQLAFKNRREGRMLGLVQPRIPFRH